MGFTLQRNRSKKNQMLCTTIIMIFHALKHKKIKENYDSDYFFNYFPISISLFSRY